MGKTAGVHASTDAASPEGVTCGASTSTGFDPEATTTRLKIWALGIVSTARYARVIKVRDERANTRMQLTTAAVTRAAEHPARRPAGYGGRGRS